MYLLVVFAGRQDAMSFYDVMIRNGCSAKIINTPRDISSSCGISVKLPTNRTKTVFMWAERNRKSGLAAVYRVTDNGYRKTYEKIF